MDDLVKRLRNSAQWHHSDCALKMECADRIEADAKRIEGLIKAAEARNALLDDQDKRIADVFQMYVDANEARIDAEARVKALEDALLFLKANYDVGDVVDAALEGEK